MTQTIKIRNEPAQHIGVANSAPCPEMNIVAKEITENGRYEARTEGVTGFDPVIVNVPNGEATIDGLISGTLSGAYRNDRVTDIRSSAFEFCKTLLSADFPNVTTIGDASFSNCLALKTINFPKVTTLSSNAFAGCRELIGVDFPNLMSTGTYVFNNCKKATFANLPKLTTLNEYSLMNWNALPAIDLPSVTTIETNAFYNCYVLASVILRANTVCTLKNTSAFKNCYHILGTAHATHNPEGLADGYIYVPDNLVEDYKVATNWATYASQIKPLSELEE